MLKWIDKSKELFKKLYTEVIDKQTVHFHLCYAAIDIIKICARNEKT